MSLRAYSLVTLKAVDSEQRIIEGIASTPQVDRQADIVDPEGATYHLPLPLLWQHRDDQPLGSVIAAKATSAGIWIRAQIAKSGVAPFIDDAWALIKSGLVPGLSVRILAIEATRRERAMGLHIKKWEMLEVSAVTVPANRHATIAIVKSLDAPFLAAHGNEAGTSPNTPGASGTSRGSPATGQSAMSKPISQQIEELETKRTDVSVKIDAFMTKGLDALDETETSQYDEHGEELQKIDKQIERLRVAEQAQMRKASVIVRPNGDNGNGRVAGVEFPVKAKEYPKGTLFTRYAMSKAAGRGSLSDTLAYAQRWSDTPEVVQFIKAEAGTSVVQSPGWGGELVYATNLVSEFVELLRAATVMGRISGWRNVPFNVRIPIQTGGSTVNWVGEEAPKPVTELAFDTMTVPYHKIAGIVVLTEELVRLSSPSAEETVRRDLTEQIARFIDVQLLLASVGSSANNPASLTNGVSATSASGTDADALYVDLNTALATFDGADMGTESVHIVTTPALARGISTLRNALGQFEFSSTTPMGGSLLGFPVVVSNSVPSGYVILIKANEVFVADDGRVSLDASNQATLDMAGGSSPAFSLWQNNCIGIRAERWITWIKRRSDAVALITGATYGPAAGS